MRTAWSLGDQGPPPHFLLGMILMLFLKVKVVNCALSALEDANCGGSIDHCGRVPIVGSSLGCRGMGGCYLGLGHLRAPAEGLQVGAVGRVVLTVAEGAENRELGCVEGGAGSRTDFCPATDRSAWRGLASTSLNLQYLLWQNSSPPDPGGGMVRD